MRIMNLFFLVIILTAIFCFSSCTIVTRPSLKQLIAESKNHDGIRVTGFSGLFSETNVRKRFFGDEAAFLREVAELLQTGDDTDVWDVGHLILSLNIEDENVSKLLRERFVLSDLGLKENICILLARHPFTQENFEFLVGVLEQSDHPAVLRVTVASHLSYSQMEYFEELDAVLKERIINAFLECLDDDREYQERYGATYKVGDYVASLIGFFGSFARQALPKVKTKFMSVQDETEFSSVVNKLRLACSIVCIVPEQCDDELQYILQKTTGDGTESVRLVAISCLEYVPPSLSENVVPILCATIQKESNINMRIGAAKSLETILSKKASLIDSIAQEQGDDVGE